MTFASLQLGSIIFVDANILVYAFAPDPVFGPACRALLERVELGELVGVTSAVVVHDVAHRLMTMEACATFGWPYAGIAGRLAGHPEDVVKLVRYRESIDSLEPMGMQVLPVGWQHVKVATLISQQTGLLSNDALVLAIMQDYGLMQLASHDSDFDRIAKLQRFSPA